MLVAWTWVKNWGSVGKSVMMQRGPPVKATLYFETYRALRV